MAKKQKTIKPKKVPSKLQLSKWQRQAKVRRIIIIATAVFLSGLMGYVGYGYYNDEFKPLHEVVFEVNDASFNMNYYVNMLDASTKQLQPDQIQFMEGKVVDQIEQDELIRQWAESLGIKVSSKEISELIKKNEFPDNEVYQDIIAASLLREKIQTYFSSLLPDKMEQAHIQMMLVESKEVADEVIVEIESGGNFTALTDKFSYGPNSKGQGGDIGWWPEELLPAPINEAFVLKPGEVSQPLYDEAVTKNIGYWLIEVIDKDEDKGIEARALLLGSKSEADEIRTKLNSGNFTSLAKEYSQHLESKNDGGELGWIKQGDMGSIAFDEIAFNITSNKVSDPIKDVSVLTKGGYWIVKVLDKGEHEISDDIRRRLAAEQFNEWFQEHKATSVINNYLDEEKMSWAAQRVRERR